MGVLDGKVAIITGAGHGLGRSHAVAMAREGVRIVVNDLGTDASGRGASDEPASETARLVKEAGSDAVTHYGDCADWNAGREMVELAVDTFGRLDILVNNAGFIRDHMPFNLPEEDWDDVVRVNLKGHMTATRFACEYWRTRSKAGQHVSGRIINTTSASGLWGNAGQPNYAAAKAGIVGLTLSLANAMGHYGVTANAIARAADTRPEVGIRALPDDIRQALRPEQVSPLVVFLTTDAAADITGRVFHIGGGRIDRVDVSHLVDGIFKRDEPWTVEELSDRIHEFIGEKTPSPEDVMLPQLAAIAESLGGASQS